LVSAVASQGFYHGHHLGYFLPYFLSYIKLLFPAVLLGVGLFVATFKFFGRKPHEFVAATCVIVSLWSSIYVKVSKRLQNELSLLYGNYHKAEVENFEDQRFFYRGAYKVDQLNYDIKKFDRFTAFKRRFLVRVFFEFFID
jgi:hypothetical protein